METYCSDANKWSEKILSGKEYCFWSSIDKHGISYNGKLRWVTRDGDVVSVDPFSNGEVIRHLLGPPDEEYGYRHYFCDHYCIGEYNGSFRVTRSRVENDDSDDGPPNLTIWDLEDYDSQKWNLKHVIVLFGIIEDIGKPVFDPRDRNVVYWKDDKKGISFNVETEEWTDLGYLEDPAIPRRYGSYSCYEVFPFVQLPLWPTPLPTINSLQQDL